MAKLQEPTWSDAMELAIIELGYIATLKQIYQTAPKFKKFSGLTPHKTINERVQRDDRFYKLRPGLYGLKTHLDKLPDAYNPKIKKTAEQESLITHAFVQGMLIEVGNILGYRTFCPDKSGIFLTKKLEEITTQKEIPLFTFENIVNKSVRYIDVVWFNERQFPKCVIEVENTTDIRDGLVKFVELQDFMTEMMIIAPQTKFEKFNIEIAKSAFVSIKNRVKFFDYEYVEKLYNHQIASQQFKSFF
ncbi:MAG: hypothetical protein MUE85_08390 [Microscillaceae bacterium]|jgi:hypothetical protein|nr:hypothetical protein [Microscillaceae bacterium]